MRITIPLALLVLVGCHGRFRKAVPDIQSVRAEVITLSGPSVLTPQVGGTGIIAAAVNITQSVRAGNIAAHIQDKVDPSLVNQAFADGFADALRTGPPFPYDPNAQDLIQFELVDWGMEMYDFFSPGVFNYNLVVRGYRADGRTFYKTRVRCATNAGATGFSEMSPFGGANNPNTIKNIPAEKIQAIFDATAADCAHQALRKMRRHAG